MTATTRDLFDQFAPPARWARTNEATAIYDAVLLLRRRGRGPVYRVSSTQHKVRGRLLSTPQLIALAAAVAAKRSPAADGN